jgi:hypothetical protein
VQQYNEENEKKKETMDDGKRERWNREKKMTRRRN